jgi:ribonuclease J
MNLNNNLNNNLSTNRKAPSRVYHGGLKKNLPINNNPVRPAHPVRPPMRPVARPNITRRQDNNLNFNNTISSTPASINPSGVGALKMKKPTKRFSMPRTRPNIGSASQVKHGVKQIIPDVGPDTYRIIPLGGVEEIGMNMTVFENEHDIIVIDAGFKFKEEATPGIDYILPNTKYLEERKHKIRAMIVTHGHLDHIGAIPYIIEKIGMPPVYTRNLTSLMLKKRQAEFPHIAPLDFKIIEGNESIIIGQTSVKFYGVTHSIPDSMGIIIDTPYGWITTPGDFKLDHLDEKPTADEEGNYSIFDGKKEVLLLLGESTNIENPGFSTPESLVHDNLEKIVKEIKGRIIIGMFASHFFRIAKIVETCESYNKKLVIEGRSMKNNIDIMIQAGLLTIKKDTVINAQDMSNYAPDKIVILATGAQADEFAALMRIATKQHKYIQINERDTVLLSSSIIPGNEKAVQKMKDNIARSGAKIMHYRTSDVFIHATGHAYRGEIEWLHRKLKPKFFMPMHGTHYHLRLHADLANELGMPKENIIVPDDCNILEIRDKGTKFVKLDVKAPDNVVMVDGFTVGDIQDVVLRDRQILAEDGIFVIVAMLNPMTGRLIKSPDIISRGSVYLRESQDLLREIRTMVRTTIEKAVYDTRNTPDLDYVKDIVTDTLGKFIFRETAKRPIIIPVVLFA